MTLKRLKYNNRIKLKLTSAPFVTKRKNTYTKQGFLLINENSFVRSP